MKPIVRTNHSDCWGCKACEIACLQEHNLPKGIKLLQVIEEKPKIIDNKLSFTFRSKRCQHCENPLCQTACPEQAISKDEETGIVLIDNNRCTGCHSVSAEGSISSDGDLAVSAKKIKTPCVAACPFESIIFDKKAGKARKCDLCHFRVTNGLIPACADNVCLAHCIYFGDRREINKRIKEQDWLKYRKEGKLKEMVIRLEE